MKNIITTLFLISTFFLYAQKKEFTYDLQGITKVIIDTDSKLKVTTNSSNQLILSHKMNDDDHCGDCYHDQDDDHDESFKEKTKGLTAIYPGGKDDTDGFGLSLKKEGTTLTIIDLKSHVQRNSLAMSLPKHINIVFNHTNLGSLDLTGFTSEIEASTNVGKINIKDVTGPITVHSNVGNINVDFSNVNQTSPITISTNVSEVDVSLPKTTKANLDLSTRGTIYTNFDIKTPEKNGLKAIRGDQKIQSPINNGGVKIKLKSNLGNIYLRKK